MENASTNICRGRQIVVCARSARFFRHAFCKNVTLIPLAAVRGTLDPDQPFRRNEMVVCTIVKNSEEKTMTPRAILFFSLPALLISAAHAQVSIDVSKITCSQMRNVTNPVAVALWLNGYYAGKRNDTTIDVVALDKNAEKVSQYCVSNADVTLMKAIETVGAAK